MRGNDPFKKEKRVTYNGAMAKALIDQVSHDSRDNSQDSDGNDGVLEFKKNDAIYITNCRVSSVNDKKGIGGGMGLYMGYYKGVQVPF